MEIITTSAQETENLGEKLAADLIGYAGSAVLKAPIFALYGELGVGKTTFARGFARGLGITDRILSPTFIIVRQYSLIQKPFETLYHTDLYNVQNEEEWNTVGLGEVVSNPLNIVLIEWAEKARSYLPQKRTDIFFKQIDEMRKIVIARTGGTRQSMISEIASPASGIAMTK